MLFKNNAESPEKLHELINIGNKEITVFEMLPKVGKDVGKSTKWILLGNLSSHGINTITDAKVVSIDKGEVTFEKDDKKESIKFDTVVNAVGSKSVTKISESIEKTGIPFSLVGDCTGPAQINKAIHEAFLAVMSIDKQ